MEAGGRGTDCTCAFPHDEGAPPHSLKNTLTFTIYLIFGTKVPACWLPLARALSSSLCSRGAGGTSRHQTDTAHCLSLPPSRHVCCHVHVRCLAPARKVHVRCLAPARKFSRCPCRAFPRPCRAPVWPCGHVSKNVSVCAHANSSAVAGPCRNRDRQCARQQSTHRVCKRHACAHTHCTLKQARSLAAKPTHDGGVHLTSTRHQASKQARKHQRPCASCGLPRPAEHRHAT